MTPKGKPTLKVLSGQENRSEEHTSELQSQSKLVCRLLLEKKNEPRDQRRSERARTNRPGRAARAGRRPPPTGSGSDRAARGTVRLAAGRSRRRAAAGGWRA